MNAVKKKIIRHRASKAFIEAIEKNGTPLFLLASFVKIHPSVMSRVKNGDFLWGPEKEAVKEVAKYIGFKGQCFEEFEEVQN